MTGQVKEEVKAEEVIVYTVLAEHLSADALEAWKKISRPSFGLDVPSNEEWAGKFLQIFDDLLPACKERAAQDKVENFTMQINFGKTAEGKPDYICTRETAAKILEDYKILSVMHREFTLTRLEGKIPAQKTVKAAGEVKAKVNPNIFVMG